MDRMQVVLLLLLSIIVLPMIASTYAETIAPFIHRRTPNFSDERQVLLLWGILIIAAFAFQFVVAILLLFS